MWKYVFGQLYIWPCRYDVAFDTNVMGAKHICEFAKRCSKLKMLLHVSTGRKQQSCVPCSGLLQGTPLTYLIGGKEWPNLDHPFSSIKGYNISITKRIISNLNPYNDIIR